jgi:hypothetical protein
LQDRWLETHRPCSCHCRQTRQVHHLKSSKAPGTANMFVMLTVHHSALVIELMSEELSMLTTSGGNQCSLWRQHIRQDANNQRSQRRLPISHVFTWHLPHTELCTVLVETTRQKIHKPVYRVASQYRSTTVTKGLRQSEKARPKGLRLITTVLSAGDSTYLYVYVIIVPEGR